MLNRESRHHFTIAGPAILPGLRAGVNSIPSYMRIHSIKNCLSDATGLRRPKLLVSASDETECGDN